MLQTTDFYPTREANKENRFSRKEPVVHASPAQRAEGPLSEKELKQYERDGFLSLEGYFSPDAVAPFFDELHQIEKDPEMCRKDQVIMDPNQHKVRSVFDMHSISSAFDRMTRHPHLLAMVQQLLGSDVYIHQSRINDKSGFCGNGFEWHSDFETWHSEDGMPSMRAVSASIMLTDNNAFNGPLMLIPGSHQSFVPCPGETPEGNWTQSLQNRQWACLPVKPSLIWPTLVALSSPWPSRFAVAVRMQHSACVQRQYVALASVEPFLCVQQR